MRARAVVIAGLVTAVAVGGTANAAGHKAKHKSAPPVCNLVTDPAGDAPFDPTSAGAPGAPNDPNGDILSADLASDGKFVTAVIRVKSVATPAQPTVPSPAPHHTFEHPPKLDASGTRVIG